MNPPPAPQRTVIEAGWNSVRYWRELWAYRELLAFLAWRDLKVRYREAALGIAWALIQPAAQTLILTFVFSRVAGLDSGGLPYPLLVMSALIPWQFFSGAFGNAGNSLLGNSHLISKVYFPRLIIPMSSLVVVALDALIVLGFTLVGAAFFGCLAWSRLALLPLFALPLFMITFGAGLWSTAITVKYRDFRFITPFLIQAGLFLTPIGYTGAASSGWREWLALNPLTGVVEGFRWAMLDKAAAPGALSLAMSLASGLLLLASGLWYFRRSEQQIADLL